MTKLNTLNVFLLSFLFCFSSSIANTAEQNKNDNTSLFTATETGDIEMITKAVDISNRAIFLLMMTDPILLDTYSNEHQKNLQLNVTHAVWENSPETLKLFLKDVVVKKEVKSELLMWAIRRMEAWSYQKMALSLYPNVLSISSYKRSAWQANNRSLTQNLILSKEIINLLLDNGAELDIKTKGLILEIIPSGLTELVEILLESGIDANKKYYSDGKTALELASYFGFEDIIHLLLDKGAKPRSKDLFHIASHGNTRIGEKFINLGVNINAPNFLGETALMRAAYKGHIDFVKMLLDNGADPDITAKNGHTALKKASNQKHEEIVKVLKTTMCQKSFS